MTDRDGVAAVALKWMLGRTSSDLQFPDNHSVVITASDRADRQAFGSTYSGDPISCLWMKYIETGVQTGQPQGILGLNDVMFAGEILVHELAHQWSVNAGHSGEHCTFQAFDDGAKSCNMNVSAGYVNFDDGRVRFHYVGTHPGSADSEYISIRSFKEPKK